MKVEMVTCTRKKQNLAISIFVSVSGKFFKWCECIYIFQSHLSEIFANVQVYVVTHTNTLNRI